MEVYQEIWYRYLDCAGNLWRLIAIVSKNGKGEEELISLRYECL